MTDHAKQILADADNGLCPICKNGILNCAVIDYQEFHGVQVGVCGKHIKYERK